MWISNVYSKVLYGNLLQREMESNQGGGRRRGKEKERGAERLMSAVERGRSEESREVKNKQNDVGNLLVTNGHSDVWVWVHGPTAVRVCIWCPLMSEAPVAIDGHVMPRIWGVTWGHVAFWGPYSHWVHAILRNLHCQLGPWRYLAQDGGKAHNWVRGPTTLGVWCPWALFPPRATLISGVFDTT